MKNYEARKERIDLGCFLTGCLSVPFSLPLAGAFLGYSLGERYPKMNAAIGIITGALISESYTILNPCLSPTVSYYRQEVNDERTEKYFVVRILTYQGLKHENTLQPPLLDEKVIRAIRGIVAEVYPTILGERWISIIINPSIEEECMFVYHGQYYPHELTNAKFTIEKIKVNASDDLRLTETDLERITAEKCFDILKKEKPLIDKWFDLSQ